MAELYEIVALLIGIPVHVLDMGAALASIGVAFITALFGPPLAVYWYKKRRYLDHITFSINEFKDENNGNILLRIRTVEILPRSDLLPSNWMLNLKLLMAIRRCTLSDPFISLQRHDMDVLQPPIISAISKTFSDGILAELAGLPVVKQEYLMAITFERYGSSASFKIRVLIVTEDDLKKFLNPDFCSRLRFERAHHADRLKTLRLMAHRRREELEDTNVDDVRVIRVVQGTFRK